MSGQLILLAAAVVDAIWWPVVIGVPIYAALTFAAGVVRIRAMESLMTAHLRIPPPPPPPNLPQAARRCEAP